MSLEELKTEVTLRNQQEQAELIGFTLKLRHAHDPAYQQEVADRLNDQSPSHWLTPDEFERRLDRPQK